MTKLFAFGVVLASLLFTATPAKAEWGRTYLSGGPPPTVQPAQKDGVAPVGDSSSSSSIVVPLNASGSWWLSPSVGFDVFTYDIKTHAYSVGIIPGVGYGLKYRPANWTATDAVFAIDLFVQAGLLDETNTIPGGEYFSIQAIPIVTLLDWFSVGFGPDALLGVSSAPSELHWMFSFGLRKST